MLFLPGATKSVGSNEFVLKTAQEQNRIKKIVEMKKNNPLKKDWPKRGSNMQAYRYITA